MAAIRSCTSRSRCSSSAAAGPGEGADSNVEPALHLAQPGARREERNLGLAAPLRHPLELRELGTGRLQRGLRLVVLLELPFELADPLPGGIQVGGEPAALLQRLACLHEPLGLGAELALRRALPRLGLGDRPGTLLELLPLALEGGEHALDRAPRHQRPVLPTCSPPRRRRRRIACGPAAFCSSPARRCTSRSR